MPPEEKTYVLVWDHGRIIPGQETAFMEMLQKERNDLLRLILQNPGREEDDVKMCDNLDEFAYDSLTGAAYRLGAGTISRRAR